MEAWACCLLDLWEGSQWFAKNSPKSWLCLPVGSRVPPCSGAKALADGPFKFPVTGTLNGVGSGNSRLSLGEGASLSRPLAGTWGQRNFLFHSEFVSMTTLPPLIFLAPQRICSD